MHGLTNPKFIDFILIYYQVSQCRVFSVYHLYTNMYYVFEICFWNYYHCHDPSSASPYTSPW